MEGVKRTKSTKAQVYKSAAFPQLVAKEGTKDADGSLPILSWGRDAAEGTTDVGNEMPSFCDFN